MKKKVLLVDDEPLLLQALSRVLKRGGLQISAVGSGEEALRAVDKDFYDLCFLDVCMPGMSGVQVTQAIKEKSPDTLIVIMTASCLSPGEFEAIESEAHFFLEKPFDLAEVKNIIVKTFDSNDAPNSFVFMEVCPSPCPVPDAPLPSSPDFQARSTLRQKGGAGGTLRLEKLRKEAIQGFPTGSRPGHPPARG